MAPDSEAPATDAVGRRTHPASGVVQGLIWAGIAIVGLLGSIGQSGGWGELGFVVSALIALLGGAIVGQVVGFLTWWSTRYVIDVSEVRVNRGIVWHSVRRVPFERIQSVDVAEPFVARLFGLAELRIESAGGKESRTALRFFPVADARAMRRLLLDRAHGREHVAPDSPDAVVDEGLELITHVPGQRIVVGTVLTLDFLAAATGAIALVVGVLWFDAVVGLLGGALALAFALVQMIGKRVIADWDFSLQRGENGLRIEKGLLSRTSRSIPYSRVQGVAIEEPWLWRRLGWSRLLVDVAGTAGGSESDGGDLGSTLLPIADPVLAAAVLEELIPGARPDDVPRVPASPRSRLFAPIGWRYRWVGADDAAFVARTGWLKRRTDVVPHARTQSVAFSQGPLQRRLGVATVQVHVPAGPVDADGRHLEAESARDVALAQLTRARTARS